MDSKLETGNSKLNFYAGLDIGSTMTKAVVVDGRENVLASLVGPTGAEHRHLALKVMDEAVRAAGLAFEDLDFIVATGYGRINVPFSSRGRSARRFLAGISPKEERREATGNSNA